MNINIKLENKTKTKKKTSILALEEIKRIQGMCLSLVGLVQNCSNNKTLENTILLQQEKTYFSYQIILIRSIK